MSNVGWDDNVTLRQKSAGAGRTAKTSSQVNAAARSGDVDIEQRNKRMNQAHSQDNRHLAKLYADEAETFEHKEVPRTISRAIQVGRQQQGLTQQQLATLINEKATVVNQYEQGKGIPNPKVLEKMERHLMIKLRGKDIGHPIQKRVPKKAQ